MTRLAIFAAAAVLALFATGCHEPKSMLLKRPQNPIADKAVTQLWADDIKRIAKDGDWLLTRGYYITSDAITVGTGGEDISHASIYDAKRGTIIEAVGSGVREITIEELLVRNNHIIIVRPGNMTAEQGTHAVARARTRVGTPFDFRGMFGWDNKDAVYCSELVWWASQGELRTGDHHRVITPGDLMGYGQVVYWSGSRNDAQVQELAVEHARKVQLRELAAAPVEPEAPARTAKARSVATR